MENSLEEVDGQPLNCENPYGYSPDEFEQHLGTTTVALEWFISLVTGGGERPKRFVSKEFDALVLVTRPLTMSELIERGLGIDELATRLPLRRRFLSKTIEFQYWPNGALFEYVENYLPDFTIVSRLEQPNKVIFSDFYLEKAYKSGGINYSALALLGLRLYKENYTIKQLNDTLKLQSNQEPRLERNAGLLASFVSPKSLTEILQYDLINDDEIPQYYEYMANLLVENAFLGLPTSSKNDRFPFPFPTGAETSDDCFPALEFLPYIVDIYNIFLLKLPGSLKEGTKVNWTKIRAEIGRLKKFILSVLEYYQIAQYSSFFNLVNEKVINLDEILLYYQNHPGLLNHTLGIMTDGSLPDELNDLRKFGAKMTSDLFFKSKHRAYNRD